ncbi:helix-turn-helix domain-containing protein [Streptomyces californicus]|uniref:helix-turn-helix domain-containing protein n=1 Tax=Streptomyces californicus TaxID=67351 RepID=UPI0037FA381E
METIMPRWSEYTTGERVKILRGKNIRQTDLAEMTGLSVPTIQQVEQDKRLTLPTLMALAAALRVDTAVILGQQEPRRAMDHGDRTTMRNLSVAVHDTAVGLLPADSESPSSDELRQSITRCWDLYWQGRYVEAGGVAALLLAEAGAHLHAQPADAQAEAWSYLCDAYRLSAYVANLMGSRDLAYAAIGHAAQAADRTADDMRGPLVASGRAWIYLRDARLDEALALAEKSAVDIEPRFSTATMGQLVAYGSHVNFAAVVASRMGNKERATDYLSQSHATGARMGVEHRAHGTLFGPVSATTQAVGINVALGHTGKALTLIKSIKDVSPLSEAARNRYAMDKAMAQADAKQWDASLDTLESALVAAPDWARHQALPSVIVQKVGRASTARLRRVSKLIGAVPPGADGFTPATARTAL